MTDAYREITHEQALTLWECGFRGLEVYIDYWGQWFSSLDDQDWYIHKHPWTERRWRIKESTDEL